MLNIKCLLKMQKYIVLTLFLLSAAYTAKAQQKLIFSHAQKSKEITVERNDIVKLLYTGYLGQIQEIYGHVEIINDSFIRFANNWSVRVSDIVGFRKFSKYREILQSTTQIISFVGVLVAVPTIINNNPSLSNAGRWGVSLGLGAGASLLNAILFPTRIKNFMSEGWKAKVE